MLGQISVDGTSTDWMTFALLCDCLMGDGLESGAAFGDTRVQRA